METSKMQREATINRMAVQMGNLTHDDLATRITAMIIECEGRVNRIQETMELVLEAHRQCILIHHLGKDRLEHLKRGGTYELAVPIARVQTDIPLIDYAEVSVYRSDDDGSWWVRPNSEMGDGRFKIIESRPAPEPPALISSSVWTMDKVILAPGAAVARIKELEDRLFEKMLHEAPPPMVIQTTPELIERLKNIGSMNDDQEVARTAYDAAEALSNNDADLRGRIVDVLRNNPEVKHIGKLADDLMAVIPAAQADPVEWQRKAGDYGWQRVNVEDLQHYREKGAELRALYTSPPAKPESTAISLLKRISQKIKCHDEWWMDVPERGGFDVAEIDQVISTISAQVQDECMPIPQSKETRDQVAAVMLQHGTPAQRAEAVAYARSAQVQDVAKPISITLTREQGDTPCPSHGGPAVRVSWVLAINGVEIDREDSRYAWSTTPGVNESREKEPPRAMASLRDELTEALS